MELLPRFAAVLLLLFISVQPVSAGQASGSVGLSAVDTVRDYLDALMVGDVQRLQGFLAPDIYENRRALFSNPDYPLILQEAYANATYSIIGSQAADAGKIWVEVKITLNQSDAIHSRFLLGSTNNHYHIIAEE